MKLLLCVADITGCQCINFESSLVALAFAGTGSLASRTTSDVRYSFLKRFVIGMP